MSADLRSLKTTERRPSASFPHLPTWLREPFSNKCWRRLRLRWFKNARNSGQSKNEKRRGCYTTPFIYFAAPFTEIPYEDCGAAAEGISQQTGDHPSAPILERYLSVNPLSPSSINVTMLLVVALNSILSNRESIKRYSSVQAYGSLARLRPSKPR